MTEPARPSFEARTDADRRVRVHSRGPREARFEYCRAVVAGNACFVAGTTDAPPDGRARHGGARVPPDDRAAAGIFRSWGGLWGSRRRGGLGLSEAP